MTDDIFSETPQQETDNTELTFEQKVAQQLASLKREDGSQMFDSVEKALESLAHAQKIIPTLKDDLKSKEEQVATLTTQLEKAATVEDVISRINNPTNDTNANTGVDTKDIGELVKQQMNAMREAEKIETNRKQVNEALIAKFGDAEAAQSALKSKAQELGVNTEFLASMADTSPQALLAYFKEASARPGVSTPSTTSVNLRDGNAANRSSDLEEFSIHTTSARDQVEKLKMIRQQVYEKYGVVA